MFHVPRLTTTAGQKSPHYAAITKWNKLPSDIKNSENIDQFDREVRQYLVMKRSELYS